jgi:hypothetical protein
MSQGMPPRSCDTPKEGGGASARTRAPWGWIAFTQTERKILHLGD